VWKKTIFHTYFLSKKHTKIHQNRNKILSSAIPTAYHAQNFIGHNEYRKTNTFYPVSRKISPDFRKNSRIPETTTFPFRHVKKAGKICHPFFLVLP